MKRAFRFINIAIIALLSLLLAASASAANNSKPRKAKIKVVSYNLYVGADIFRVFYPAPCGVPQAVFDLHTTIQQTNFPERAEAIADQIMYQEPHVIGLQEVALLRTQIPGDSLFPDGVEVLDEPEGEPPVFRFITNAEHVEFDYLQLLLDALEARGLDYVAVEDASPVNADVEFPAIEFDEACNMVSVPMDVRMTDRDVILVRSDLAVSEPFEGNFAAKTPINLPALMPTPEGFKPAIYSNDFLRGWGAINLVIKDQSYRVINTHLDVGDRNAGWLEDLNEVQYWQAYEMAGIASVMFQPPIILLGDINSSPMSGPTGDTRPAYSVLTGSGLSDTWNLRTQDTDDPGYTYGQSELLDNEVSGMFERIDMVLANFGDLVPEKIKAEAIGDEQADRTPSGLWPSDHAGVAAKLSFER